MIKLPPLVGVFVPFDTKPNYEQLEEAKKELLLNAKRLGFEIEMEPRFILKKKQGKWLYAVEVRTNEDTTT